MFHTLKKFSYLITTLLLASSASAFVASSTNYVLESDSINFGGLQSDSANYSLQDTFGELGIGYSTSTAYELNAGYQQQSSSTISITAAGDVILGEINGKAGNTTGVKAVSASTSFTVVTDSPTGYSLYVKAATSPAYQTSGGSFADYSASSVSWTNSPTQSQFGFSPSGSDAITAATAGLWFGFSTTNFKIASATSGNSPVGATTNITLKAEAGTEMAQPAGSYSAQIVATAIAN